LPLARNAQRKIDWQIFTETISSLRRMPRKSTGQKVGRRAWQKNLLCRVDVRPIWLSAALTSPWTLDGRDHQTGIGSWAAGSHSNRCMGKPWLWATLVLLETEINPVMLKLIEGGLEITAVHKSSAAREVLATFYMHVGGPWWTPAQKWRSLFMMLCLQARRH